MTQSVSPRNASSARTRESAEAAEAAALGGAGTGADASAAASTAASSGALSSASSVTSSASISQECNCEYHYFDVDYNFSPHQLPFMLQTVLCHDLHNLTKTTSETFGDFYYYTPGRLLVIPTIVSYYNLICKRIQNCHNIINKLITDINTELQKILTKNISNNNIIDNYLKIIIFYKILKKWQESYNEFITEHKQIIENEEFFKSIFKIKPDNFEYKNLGDILNEINFYYYLYYYIFQPDAKIALGVFHYYPLPIEQSEKILYYLNNSVRFLTNMLGEEIVVPIKPPEGKEMNQYNTRKVQLPKYDSFTTQSFTDYKKLKLEYEDNIISTYYDYDKKNTSSKQFVKSKETELPPSIYLKMNDFYKYTTIQIIKTILSKIKLDPKIFDPIKTYLLKYYKLSKVEDIYIYLVLAKIIEIIIQDKYKEIIHKAINTNKNFIQHGSGNTESTIDIVIFDLSKKAISISLDLTSILPKTFDGAKNYNDLYKLIKLPTPDECNPSYECTFILYPNDLTNIHKFKMKYCIMINSDIVNELLVRGGTPTQINNENITSLYYLLKNYNYSPLEIIMNKYKEFKLYLDIEPYKQYITEELRNIINKINPPMSGITSLHFDSPVVVPKQTLNCILNNFNEYLYGEVHQLIISNNRFGNNEFEYLKLSFNISTYLVIHYLSNIISNESAVDNYFYTAIGDLKIYKNLSKLVAFELCKTKKDTFKYYEGQKDLVIGIYKTDIEKEMKQLETDIAFIESFAESRIYYYQTKNFSNSQSMGMIEEYKIFADELKQGNWVGSNDTYYGHIKLLKAWKTLFDCAVNSKNWTENNNIYIIKILLDQQKKIDNRDELKKISDELPNILYVCEKYFTTLKYTEINTTAKFIKDMLNYVAKIVFGTSIILLVRRILFTYFNTIEILEDDFNTKMKTIQAKIERIFTDTQFITTLENETLPELVTIASNIYTNKTDEMNSGNKSRQILQKLFAPFKNSSITLPDEVLNKFDKQVVEYLDLFIIRTIEMWHVNAENIFKYFINNYRCLKTLLCFI